jgi:bacterioferritin
MNHVVASISVMFMKGATMSRTKGPSSFVQDIQALRDRARQHIEDGAQTADDRADRDTVLRLLNEALATEIVCVLRYRRHYFMAQGMNAESVKAEFLTHAGEEQTHADGAES